jgi:hypothetical protein
MNNYRSLDLVPACLVTIKNELPWEVLSGETKPGLVWYTIEKISNFPPELSQKTTSPMVANTKLFPGWWLTYPSEKYEFVSWDYYSQLNGKSCHAVMFQTTNQLFVILGACSNPPVN